jgi:23S rRNA pseudouridine1911/1915/1917 synthase
MPIGKSKTDFRKQTTKNPVEGKPAVTEYKVLEYLTPPPLTPPPSLHRGEGKLHGVDGYTLLLVKLHTGRTHQIRVHLASVGHPLMGDDLYGGKRIKLNGLHRQFLHAKKIEVQLPDKTWIEAESDFPKDLKEVLVSLDSKIVNQL